MVTRREVALAGAMDRRDELPKNQFPVGDKRHGARHQGFGRDGPPRHVGGESRWPYTVGGGSHPPCKWLTSARVRYKWDDSNCGDATAQAEFPGGVQRVALEFGFVFPACCCLGCS